MAAAAKKMSHGIRSWRLFVLTLFAVFVFPAPETFAIETDSLEALSATLKVNGGSTAEVPGGAVITYTWTSTGGTTASSIYTSDAPMCNGSSPNLLPVGPAPWVAKTLNGTTTFLAAPCMAGRTLNLTFIVSDSAGKSAKSTVGVHFVNSNAPISATQKIENLAISSLGLQDSAQEDIVKINILGANQLATLAAVECAEGANAANVDQETAALHWATCENRFAAANEMAANEQKALSNVAKAAQAGALVADPEVLNSARAQAAFAEFEKNCHLSGEDYVGPLLKSGGDRETFTGMLKECLSEDKISKTFANADEVKPDLKDSDNYLVNLKGVPKDVPKNALRNALKKKILENKNREPASLGKSNQDKANRFEDPPKFEHLDPLDLKGHLIQPSDEESDDESNGLSLFDVVHIKYRELDKHFRSHRLDW